MDHYFSWRCYGTLEGSARARLPGEVNRHIDLTLQYRVRNSNQQEQQLRVSSLRFVDRLPHKPCAICDAPNINLKNPLLQMQAQIMRTRSKGFLQATANKILSRSVESKGYRHKSRPYAHKNNKNRCNKNIVDEV